MVDLCSRPPVAAAGRPAASASKSHCSAIGVPARSSTTRSAQAGHTARHPAGNSTRGSGGSRNRGWFTLGHLALAFKLAEQ